MRKFKVLTTIIIVALVLSGCGNRNTPSSQKESSTNTLQAGNAVKPSDSSPTPSSKPATESTAIIAKSENIMSSSEKEQLLNQVDKELDSLFNNINNLEDTQDADLNLSQ